MTRDGLEDQLLAAVVSMERPDLEQLKVCEVPTQQGREEGDALPPDPAVRPPLGVGVAGVPSEVELCGSSGAQRSTSTNQLPGTSVGKQKVEQAEDQQAEGSWENLRSCPRHFWTAHHKCSCVYVQN